MEKSEQKNLSIQQRARHLRHNMTDAERHLWSAINNHQLMGCKFRRQHPKGQYILDFVCIEKKLVIEIDGGQHIDSTYDCQRTAWLKQQNYQVLRFWNNEVLENIEGVIEEILMAMEK